jgi:hypothetical protein
MKQIGGEKAHAEFSASGALRWLNCPGSIALSKGVPEPPESKYAKEGTEAHTCLEFLLKNRKQLGQALTIAKKKHPIDMVMHCQATAEVIIGHLSTDPDAEFLCETRVDSSSFTCPGQFGTVDAAVVSEFDRLTVIDYKYGAGHAVDPEGPDGRGHPQLVYYALGISETYGHNFHDVELVVIQPRAYHESGEKIRSHVMSIKELLNWSRRFKAGVWAAKQESPALLQGEWCRYCPAAFKCPELKQKAMTRAQIVFSDDAGLQSVPEPRLMEKQHDLSKALKACDALEMWIKRVREHALHVLDRGGKIDGFKLVKKKAQRKWTEDAMEHVCHWYADDAFVQKMMSPAQFEKQFGDEAEAKQILKDHTVKESSGLTIAPETDKRPAQRRIEDIFDAEVIGR